MSEHYNQPRNVLEGIKMAAQSQHHKLVGRAYCRKPANHFSFLGEDPLRGEDLNGQNLVNGAQDKFLKAPKSIYYWGYVLWLMQNSQAFD